MIKIRIVVLCFLVSLAFSNESYAKVGFIAPAGVSDEFADKVDLALINVSSPEKLETDFRRAINANHLLLYLDFGDALLTPRPAGEVSLTYTLNGGERKKTLAPMVPNKLRHAPSDKAIEKLMSPYLPVLKKYRSKFSTVFVADEPYLNGISKRQMERMGRKMRSIFRKNGLGDVRLGVIFASAMFNKTFAENMNAAAVSYVASIDEYHSQIAMNKELGKVLPEELAWEQTIEKHRLTTYDAAGNMYLGGGVPEGYNLVGFDFYLSTLLQDGLYNNALSVLNKIKPDGDCKGYSVSDIKSIRSNLTFYRKSSEAELNDGAAEGDDQDRHMLDTLFACRMKVSISLLREELKKTSSKENIMIVAESSPNGVLNFDPSGVAVVTQSAEKIEERVLGEVNRAIQFYTAEAKGYRDVESLMFFTFGSVYDPGIKLRVGGVSEMPSVLRSIYEKAAR